MELQTILIFSFALIAFSLCQTSAMNETPPLCEPRVLEEMPQHIKKVCLALENSNQLSGALNAYLRNEAAGKEQYKIYLHK